MEKATVGVEFWENCPAPAYLVTIRIENRIAYGTDRGGVEYRRASAPRSQQKRGRPEFVWQRKMWRMS